MSILCQVGLHAAIPSKLWNDGHYFSECRRCGTPLIRVPQGRWTEVPRNMRVVWRARRKDDIVWPQHIL